MSPPRRQTRPADDAASTQQTLRLALGGPQKSWMTAAPVSHASVPVGPPPKKRKSTGGQPRRPAPIAQPTTAQQPQHAQRNNQPQQVQLQQPAPPTPYFMTFPMTPSASGSPASTGAANGHVPTQTVSNTNTALPAFPTAVPSTSPAQGVPASAATASTAVSDPLIQSHQRLEQSPQRRGFDGPGAAVPSNARKNQTASNAANTESTQAAAAAPSPFELNRRQSAPYPSPGAATSPTAPLPSDFSSLQNSPHPSPAAISTPTAHVGFEANRQQCPPFPTPAASVQGANNDCYFTGQATVMNGPANGSILQQHSPTALQQYRLPSGTPAARLLARASDGSAGPVTKYLTQGMCRQVLARYNALASTGRMLLLQRAIDLEDWDYLFLHQIFCMFEVSPTHLPPGILGHGRFNDAMTIISQCIGTDSQSSRDASSLLQAFPLRLDEIKKQWPAEYMMHENRFICFVNQSHQWSGVVEACLKRCFPPHVYELNRIAICSPVFQEVVFTSILRNMAFRAARKHSVGQDVEMKGHFEKACVGTFRQCQAYYQNRDSEQITQSEFREYARQLQKLYADYDRMLWASSQNLPMAYFGGEVNELRRRSLLPEAAHQLQQLQHPPNQAFANSTSPMQHMSMPDPYRTAVPGAQPLPPGMRLPSNAGPITPQPGTPGSLMYQLRGGAGSARSQPVSRGSPSPGFLLPPPGTFLPMQREPNPATFALHQADLRSAELRAEKPGDSLYQYVAGFFLPPTPIVNGLQARTNSWPLLCSPELLKDVSKELEGDDGAPPVRWVNEGTRSFRLRCIKWPAKEPPSEHQWARGETTMPLYAYFEFNKQPLHPRRKVHHGKDLPIDLSSLLREGQNTLSVGLVYPGNIKQADYMVAIEELRISTYTSIVDAVTTQRLIPSDEAKRTILRKLNPVDTPAAAAAADDDDDLIVLPQTTITLSIADPFSGSAKYRLPVRSSACLHDNCFDLENFLATRRRLADVSDPDVWKCPHCNADARPQFLHLDGFFRDVLEEVDRRGEAEWARAVVLDREGGWQVRKEEGVGETSLSRSASPVGSPGLGLGLGLGGALKRRASERERETPLRQEVILLDDDDD